MSLSDMPWGEWLTTGGLGAALMKGADLVFGRKGREVSALGDTIQILSDQQKNFAEDIKAFRGELLNCHEAHERCEQGRQEDRERHQRELAELRANIDALLKEPPLPGYHPKNLRRVGQGGDGA